MDKRTFGNTPEGAVRGRFQLWLSTIPQTQFRLFVATILSIWTAGIITWVIGAQVLYERCQPSVRERLVLPAGCQIQTEIVFAWLGFVAALAGFSYLSYRTARHTDIDYNQSKQPEVTVNKAQEVNVAAKPVPAETKVEVIEPTVTEVNDWKDGRQGIL